MGDPFVSHSPIPSVELDESTQPGFTLSDVSSLKSASSGSEHSLDKVSTFPPNLNEVEKKLKHVGYLIDEMIETESTYVKALTDVIDGYMKRLKRDISSGFNDSIIEEVFVNIEDICSFHDKLHHQLIDCDSDHKLVAKLFIENIEKLAKMYINFCSAFPKSLEKLEELHGMDPYKSALAQCQLELGHMFPVEEYLHRAVQRFLKYPLLFKDMAKKLVSVDGHEIVKEALEKLLVTAVKINSVKRVQELQANELVGWKGGDLTSMGDLLLEDSFKVAGAKDPRILFLFKNCLLFTKKKEADGIYSFKNSLPMSNITLKEQVDNDFLKWSVLGKGSESYTMLAKDPEQKDRWTRELKRCIVYSTPGLTDIQKEALLMKLPSLKNDVEHINRIWKRATKKTRKAAKRSESVKILHNTDCDSDNFSINSEISAAFDLDSPSVQNKNNSLPSSIELKDRSLDNGFDRRSALKKRPSEEVPIPEVDAPSISPLTVDPIPEVHSDSLSDTPLEVVNEGMTDEEDLVLTFKTELSKCTELEDVDLVDSDIENIQSDEDPNESVEFKTGADPALGYFTNLLLNSKFYPASILGLIYIFACLVQFLPCYLTIPVILLLSVFGYRSFPAQSMESQKKLN